MTTLPYNITITGVDQALGAANWCEHNIGNDHWNIEIADIGRPIYRFSFAQSNQASWFSLNCK